MLVCFESCQLSNILFSCRLASPEDVQFFQFDQEGNMYVFPPGSGCTGIPRLVQPGEELIFSNSEELSQDLSSNVVDLSQTPSNVDGLEISLSGASTSRPFKLPLKSGDLEDLSHKNFSPDTMKKIKWVTKMYREWRNYRHSLPKMEKVACDLDDKNSITKESFVFAMSRFLTEVKKLDGTHFPSKTLYEILICVQFHLECMGFAWKLLND